MRSPRRVSQKEQAQREQEQGSVSRGSSAAGRGGRLRSGDAGHFFPSPSCIARRIGSASIFLADNARTLGIRNRARSPGRARQRQGRAPLGAHRLEIGRGARRTPTPLDRNYLAMLEFRQERRAHLRDILRRTGAQYSARLGRQMRARIGVGQEDVVVEHRLPGAALIGRQRAQRH